MEKLPIYILAGGKSSRFGSDKARALAHGQPLILHVAKALEPRASRIAVVAREEGRYGDLGLRTIGDLEPDLGPIGGLQTALSDCREPGWILLASCDLIGARAQWIDPLLAARGDEALAVAFREDRWEPLFALYHTRILPRIVKRIAQGEGAMWRLLESLKDKAAAAETLPRDWTAQSRINTPAELEAYLNSKPKSG